MRVVENGFYGNEFDCFIFVCKSWVGNVEEISFFECVLSVIVCICDIFLFLVREFSLSGIF